MLTQATSDHTRIDCHELACRSVKQSRPRTHGLAWVGLCRLGLARNRHSDASRPLWANDVLAVYVCLGRCRYAWQRRDRANWAAGISERPTPGRRHLAMKGLGVRDKSTLEACEIAPARAEMGCGCLATDGYDSAGRAARRSARCYSTRDLKPATATSAHVHVGRDGSKGE